MSKIVGIDFGRKSGGTTALFCYDLINHEAQLHSCPEKTNADQWLLDKVEDLNPSVIGIDAPLSLPGVYLGLKDCQHYHFRKCDLELKAMSPMFLGGLTARAIELAVRWKSENKICIEVYPAAIRKLIFPDFSNYKKGHIEEDSKKYFKPFFKIKQQFSIQNWHQFDAVLAAISVLRFTKQENLLYGNEQEGLICV